ncbi:MAG: hypothetical protein ACJ76Z_08265 [Thermoleophilaceae bacterium]
MIVLAAGCGTKPLAPPDPIAVRPPGRPVQLHDPRSGLRFEAPRNWVKRIRPGPGMFRIASGGADVSGWAYPRTEQLPKTDAELATARDALVHAAQARNATFHLTRSRLTRIKGSPAIELWGTQTLLGRTIQTHSVHIYRGGEYVIEALAPAREFGVTDTKVLEPLLRSLRFRPLPPS